MDEIVTKIAFIGAGKIAYSIIPCILEKGYKLEWIIEKNEAQLKRTVDKFNPKNFDVKIKQTIQSADIFVLAVNDDQIQDTANRIAALASDFINKLFIHLSGAKNLSVLKSLKDKNASVVSCHILQTFPSFERQNIFGVYAAIQEDNLNQNTKRMFYDLLKNLELRYFKLKEEEKTIYHLAAVFISNLIVANFEIADELLNSLESELPPTEEIFSALALNTLFNISESGIEKALSGPLERGDVATIKNHLNIIPNNQIKLIYKNLSTKILETAKRKGSLDNKKYNEILKLLK